MKRFESSLSITGGNGYNYIGTWHQGNDVKPNECYVLYQVAYNRYGNRDFAYRYTYTT